MRTLLAAALAVTSLAYVTAARADAPTGIGFTCAYLVYHADATHQDAEIDAWPMVVADLPAVDSSDPSLAGWDATGNPASATVTCAIQVAGTGRYTDPDTVAVSATGVAVVTVPPTLVSFDAAQVDNIYLCTTWTLTDAHGDTATLYVDYATDELSDDPAAAVCGLAISVQ